MANLFSIFSPNKSGDKRKGKPRTGGTLKSQKQIMGRIGELGVPGKPAPPRSRKFKKNK